MYICLHIYIYIYVYIYTRFTVAEAAGLPTRSAGPSQAICTLRPPESGQRKLTTRPRGVQAFSEPVYVTKQHVTI